MYWLVLLYLQFRWLPMERNTVYIRWNVGLTTRVNDTALEVRYDAINWWVCDNYAKTSASAAVRTPSEKIVYVRFLITREGPQREAVLCLVCCMFREQGKGLNLGEELGYFNKQIN